MKKKKSNLKPTDLDVHFKYQCPNSSCNYDHWLSLNEAKTKNFKIVCDCGCISSPKQIDKIKILYLSSQEKILKTNISQPNIPIKHKQTIRVDLQVKCAKLLCGYGFTKDEALILIDRAFEKNPTAEAGLLIKYILQNLGELNVSN